MPRPRNQAQRRTELIAATKSVLASKGLNEVRLRDVAEAAGMTPSAVLYYYDGLDDLFFAVYERGVDRYCREREEAVAALGDPAEKLATAIHLGMPRSADDADIRFLWEFVAIAFRDTACAALMYGYFEREVHMYASILEDGVRAGAFRLTGDSRTLARNIVGLEDAHSVFVLTGHREPAEVERLVLDFAATATGVEARTLLGARETVDGPTRARRRRASS